MTDTDHERAPSKYDEPCSACGAMIHATAIDSHTEECWPVQLHQARTEAARLRAEADEFARRHSDLAETVVRPLQAEVARLREALGDLAPHVDNLRRLADGLHAGDAVASGRSAIAREASHAIARALLSDTPGSREPAPPETTEEARARREAWAMEYARTHVGDPYCTACAHNDLVAACEYEAAHQNVYPWHTMPDEWRTRMLRETKGMAPGEVLAHLAADYEKNGPPKEPVVETQLPRTLMPGDMVIEVLAGKQASSGVIGDDGVIVWDDGKEPTP